MGGVFLHGLFTILPVVVVMAAGWFLRSFDKIDDSGLGQINSVLFWLVMPAILFRAGLKLDSSAFSDPVYPLVLYGSFALVIALVFSSVLVLRIPKERAAVSVLGAVRSNVVFIGLPMLSMLAGSDGVAALSVYLSIGMLFYNTVPMACSQMILEGRFSSAAIGRALIDALKTPLILAGASGVALSLLGVGELIPSWLLQALDLVSDCGSGMALIVIGASLNLRGLLPSLAHSWGDITVKLLILPAVVWLGFYFFPPVDLFQANVAVLISALSPAFNTFIIANGMGMDSSYAADYIAVSTVIGIFSAALWIEFLF